MIQEQFSITSSCVINLSLHYNTIETYQSFIVLTTPIITLFTWLLYKRKYSLTIFAILIRMIAGKFISSGDPIQPEMLGTHFCTELALCLARFI